MVSPLYSGNINLHEVTNSPTRYVLSPTHLHEFKSADKTQSPVMSLYLPEQRLGSHSQEAGSSPKFILKGRQTSGVHRSHSWVFRAESYDTMMAWYEDIKALTEKTPEERQDFVRGHSRSFSRTSSRRSVSSDGVVDEDDDEPYSAHHSAAALGNGEQEAAPTGPRRPSPGGRFPSDIEVSTQRGLQAPHSPSSITGPSPSPGSHEDRELMTAAGALPGSSFDQYQYQSYQFGRDEFGGPAQNGYNTESSFGPGHVYRPSQPQPAAEAAAAPYANQQQHSEAPYANHPATLIVANAAQNEAATSHNQEESSYAPRQQPNNHENAGDRDYPVQAAAAVLPIVGERRQPPPPPPTAAAAAQRGNKGGAPYASGLDATGVKSVYAPQATVLPVNDGVDALERRPAYSERTESDAPTLSSEAQTISHLHVPGEYPRGSCANLG